jgi:hypothetical protein
MLTSQHQALTGLRLVGPRNGDPGRLAGVSHRAQGRAIEAAADLQTLAWGALRNLETGFQAGGSSPVLRLCWRVTCE